LSIASFNCNCCSEDSSLKVTFKTAWISGILINLSVPPGVPKSVLT
jgi:hypothetical protein